MKLESDESAVNCLIAIYMSDIIIVWLANIRYFDAERDPHPTNTTSIYRSLGPGAIWYTKPKILHFRISETLLWLGSRYPPVQQTVTSLGRMVILW